MGNTESAHLPNTYKASEQVTSKSTGLMIGASGMQGWRKTMEDQHIILDIPTLPVHLLVGVFDGHGGSFASDHAQTHFLDILQNSTNWSIYRSTLLPYDLAQALIETFLMLDVHMQYNLLQNVHRCGCTAVITVITPTHIICANAGDSRCVLGTNKSIKALSEDHKPNNPLESHRILQAGGVVAAGRANGAGRVEGILAVSRGFGDFYFKNREDLTQQAQKVTCDPEIIIHERTSQDDVLVLACDGLWDVLSSEEAVSLVRSLYHEGESNMLLIAEELLDQAFSKGSKDNISAVVVKLPGANIASSLHGGVMTRRGARTGEQELSSLFVQNETYCLNASPMHAFNNLNSGDDQLYLQSDTDEQLLIHIKFQTAVKITSLSFKSGGISCGSSGDEDTTATSPPKSIKLYANLANPSFTNIDDEEVSESIIIEEISADINKRVRLKPTKFQRVNSLTLFIDENQGGTECTILSELNLYGSTLDGLDVANIHNQKKSNKK